MESFTTEKVTPNPKLTQVSHLNVVLYKDKVKDRHKLIGMGNNLWNNPFHNLDKSVSYNMFQSKV